MSIKDRTLGLFRGGKFFIQEHSPEILMVVGGVSMICSIISACKATLKFQEVIKEHNNRLDTLKIVEEHQKEGTATEEEMAIDVKIARIAVYQETTKKTIILYLPTAGMAAGALISNLKAFGIVRKWYGAAMVTIAGLSKENEHLKTGIVQEYGEEALQKLQVDAPRTIVDVNEETGEATETQEPGTQYGAHTKIFDESNPNWEKNAESNMNFLLLKQTYANHLLHNRLFDVPGVGKIGFVFENEVLDMVDIEKTQGGQINGWIFYADPEVAKQHPESDGYIDFGIFDKNDPAKRRFVNGYERSIWINLNVDRLPILGRTGLAVS